jgi:hypothetical protein
MGCFTKRSVQRYDLFVQLYHTYTVLTAAFNGMVLNTAAGTWVARALYKMYGANVKLCGNAIIWGSMLDQDNIFIEDNSVVGDGVGICGHNYEHAGLKFAPTTVAANCTLYPLALMMAGDSMQDYSTLASKSKPFGPNDPCESETMNVGCPARWATLVDTVQDSEYHSKISSLRPGAGGVHHDSDGGDSMEASLLGGSSTQVSPTKRERTSPSPQRSGGGRFGGNGEQRYELLQNTD